MKFLDQFILNIPYLFLKKIPYAWIAVVYFWGWPPVFSGILLGIVLVGLLMMRWQNHAWEASTIRDFHSGAFKPIVDHPHAARLFQIRNLLIVLLASAGLGWLLNGRFGMSGLQWFLLMAGFMFLYRDAVLFGASVSYILTDQGIGIRFVPGHVDYRLFFTYREIRQAVRTKVPVKVPPRWDRLTPQKRVPEGLLLYAARMAGFSKQLQGELLLAPADIKGFLAELSHHVEVIQGD
jgi:hypothetical protein